jgi:IS1 family transposase
MPRSKLPDLTDIKRTDLSAMSRDELEELTWRLHELARSLANRVGEDSATSSRPPSSDDPYRRGAKAGQDAAAPDRDDDAGGGASPTADADTTGDSKTGKGKTGSKQAAKPAGKRPGTKGFWRRLPIVVNAEARHAPHACSACQAAFAPTCQSRHASAHISLELTRGEMALQVSATKHLYLALRCDCGHETIAQPGTGLCSHVGGRRRDLHMSERCLVGPMLASFIAALSLRFRLSRVKIAEFLRDWLGVELGVATIERCIHEFGLASEPVVEQLIEDMRAAEIVHLDETPWYQQGRLLWLWVAVTAGVIVYRIGSRRREELVALIGEAFLGWLVTDGYGAYRDHPRRQRCLAHLIRKARALAEGYYGTGSGFGHDLVRDLRRLIERVHEGGDAAAIQRLTTRIKWTCQCNRHEIDRKVRDLAGEILNDWDAVIAFVADPNLPPTNNDAERALRHAVITRRISFGTRTDEGSRFYAAALSIIDTCRKRGADPWAYACSLIAAARASSPLPAIPASPAG